MCKLNLHCSKDDGECNCHKSGSQLIQSNKTSNSLLCSILSLIKAQPEIMEALSTKKQESLDLLETPSLNSISLTTQDTLAQYKVNIISEVPSVLILGRGFPLMAEIVDCSSNRADFGEVSFKATLEDDDGNEKVVLGQVKSSQTAFFRKLVVTCEDSDLNLVISAEGKDDIAAFKKKIRIKSRKSKDLTAKRVKNQEDLIINE